MPRYPRLWSIALPPAALIAIALGWHLTTPADRAAVSWPSTAAAAEAPQEIPASTASPSPPVDLNELEEDELAPGLVAIYRSLDKDHAAPQVARIDPKPAFTWGDSSPHPRIPPGPFEVVWTGVISLYERGEIRFGAYLGGDATVVIDGETVLQARGRSANDWVGSPKGISREAGLYRVRVVFRSLAGVPARIQIWWQGESFSREPLPASRLMHVKRELPEAARQEELIARGRDAVERFGCRRCHSAALPSVADFAPGPSLAGLGKRVSRRWLFDWLADPAKVRPHARMPIVFAEGREGLAERQLVADFLLKSTGPANASNKATPGDFRAGRQAFLGTGCIACHVDPEKAGPGASAEGKSAAPNDPERIAYHALADRFTPESLAAFLVDPASRYPDRRMPKLPLADDTARHIAAFLLLWSKSARAKGAGPVEAEADVIESVVRRLNAADREAAGRVLVREKGCVRCHTGLEELPSPDVPIRQLVDGDPKTGCLSGNTLPRFTLDEETRHAIAAYLDVARQERHVSRFDAGQRLLAHAKCHRCHTRDGDRPPPLEEIGRTVWIPFLYRIPYQRMPRLNFATTKFTRDYLLASVRDGVNKVRPDWYSYRMPAFGDDAEKILRALAEGDGDLPPAAAPPPSAAAPDPALVAMGPALVGFEGYGCVTCHVWKAAAPGGIEPSAVGPELTSVTARVRRAWFDRFLDDTQRVYRGTPMPSVFPRGKPAHVRTVLGGDASRQKEAIWAYLSQGPNAADPKVQPPLAVPSPRDGELIVAQIPVQLPDRTLLESICLWNSSGDIVLYDVGQGAPHSSYGGARLLRQSSMWRSFTLSGNAVISRFAAEPPLALVTVGGRERPEAIDFQGYDRLPQGVAIRSRYRFASATLDVTEALSIETQKDQRRLLRELRFAGLAPAQSIELRSQVPAAVERADESIDIGPSVGQATGSIVDGVFLARFTPDPKKNTAAGTIRYALPPAQSPADTQPPTEAVPTQSIASDEGLFGPYERPGYRALLYPRPKTSSGEDQIMPSALAVDPKTGRLFVASMKLGELLVLDDPDGDGKDARFRNYVQGHFQDVFGMLHDGRDLFVLHRRNLTRATDTNRDGFADRFDRIAPLSHSVGDSYDWAYGLVRDRSGAFVFTFAPHANQQIAGSGSVLRLSTQGGAIRQEEVAFGLRNPLGWATGPEGEIFFTDNQGDWVATNKLCHVDEGRFFGFPNGSQPQHREKPAGRTAVWVPYDWANSINGLAYDGTGGKFGPFAGQFFLAELMHGGAIVRAQVEEVNGVWQGACFPFWGRGLLGPLVLAFDPKGRLYVGSVTTPGWMGQPDRGALFRLEFTGETPFEIESIHVRPRGFRLLFTRPVNAKTAADVASYRIEHYRYEYTGAYGSPELDRTAVPIESAAVSGDGCTVDLVTGPLVKDRVYRITAQGVRSQDGEGLVHPTGAYTLNEIPAP